MIEAITYLFIFGCAGSWFLHGLCLVAASRGYTLVGVCGLLLAVASLVADMGSRAFKLQ